MIIRFREEHLRRFSLASMDVSPLHTSESYARKTPFGERLVYGSLAFAACLGRLPLPEGKMPSSVSVEYKGALILDVDYRLQVKQEASGMVKAALMDGSVTVMRIRLQFRDGSPELAVLPELGVASRTESRQLDVAGFAPGLGFCGRYGPPRKEYLELLELLGIDRERWGDGLLLAALCASYLSGMELPGESGASAGLKAEILEPRPELPSDFDIELRTYDPRFGLVESHFSLTGASGTYARGTIGAIVRPSLAKSAPPAARVGSERFAGKTALVIGASRGLGAAMALELAAEGCAVLGVYWRSGDEAAAVAQAGRGLPGRLIMEQGDASDPHWCSAMKGRIQAEFGRLDLLICNAAPAIQPLRVEEACYGRIQTYLQKGFALVGAPLTSFLGLVAAAQGGVLLISSAAVENPPGTWPHYVALKGAVEGLLRAAAADHPKVKFWVARPNKIETDLINTPLGRLDAEKPETVARRILAYAAANAAPGTVHFCG